MELIIRTGADKRKAKIIEDLRNQLKIIEDELRITKIERNQYKTKISILNKSLNYYKKKNKNRE